MPRTSQGHPELLLQMEHLCPRHVQPAEALIPRAVVCVEVGPVGGDVSPMRSRGWGTHDGIRALMRDET